MAELSAGRPSRLDAYMELGSETMDTTSGLSNSTTGGATVGMKRAHSTSALDPPSASCYSAGGGDGSGGGRRVIRHTRTIRIGSAGPEPPPYLLGFICSAEANRRASASAAVGASAGTRPRRTVSSSAGASAASSTESLNAYIMEAAKRERARRGSSQESTCSTASVRSVSGRSVKTPVIKTSSSSAAAASALPRRGAKLTPDVRAPWTDAEKADHAPHVVATPRLPAIGSGAGTGGRSASTMVGTPRISTGFLDRVVADIPQQLEELERQLGLRAGGSDSGSTTTASGATAADVSADAAELGLDLDDVDIDDIAGLSPSDSYENILTEEELSHVTSAIAHAPPPPKMKAVSAMSNLDARYERVLAQTLVADVAQSPRLLRTQKPTDIDQQQHGKLDAIKKPLEPTSSQIEVKTSELTTTDSSQMLSEQTALPSDPGGGVSCITKPATPDTFAIAAETLATSGAHLAGVDAEGESERLLQGEVLAASEQEKVTSKQEESGEEAGISSAAAGKQPAAVTPPPPPPSPSTAPATPPSPPATPPPDLQPTSSAHSSPLKASQRPPGLLETEINDALEVVEEIPIEVDIVPEVDMQPRMRDAFAAPLSVKTPEAPEVEGEPDIASPPSDEMDPSIILPEAVLSAYEDYVRPVMVSPEEGERVVAEDSDIPFGSREYDDHSESLQSAEVSLSASPACPLATATVELQQQEEVIQTEMPTTTDQQQYQQPVVPTAPGVADYSDFSPISSFPVAPAPAPVQVESPARQEEQEVTVENKLQEERQEAAVCEDVSPVKVQEGDLMSRVEPSSSQANATITAPTDGSIIQEHGPTDPLLQQTSCSVPSPVTGSEMDTNTQEELSMRKQGEQGVDALRVPSPTSTDVYNNTDIPTDFTPSPADPALHQQVKDTSVTSEVIISSDPSSSVEKRPLKGILKKTSSFEVKEPEVKVKDYEPVPAQISESIVSKDSETGTKSQLETTESSQPSLTSSLPQQISAENKNVESTAKDGFSGKEQQPPVQTQKPEEVKTKSEKNKSEAKVKTEKLNAEAETAAGPQPHFPSLADVMSLTSFNPSALDVRMRLTLLDLLINLLLLTPLTVLFYYATCRLMELCLLCLFPQLGAWLLLFVGAAIEFAASFWQKAFTARAPQPVPGRGPFADVNLPFLLTSKCYNFVLGLGNVFHMLAMSSLVDSYVGTGYDVSLRVALTSLVVLWTLRCGRNVLAPPLYVGIDADDIGVFRSSTMFKVEPDLSVESSADILGTVGVVMSFVHLHWAGVWNCADATLFPSSFALSMVTSLLLGAVICILFLLLQQDAMEISRKLEREKKEPLRLIFENVFVTTANVGVILLWRGLWMVYDLMGAYFPIYCRAWDITPFATCVLSFLLLALAHCSSTVLFKGCEIDGELTNGEGVKFATGYFTEILHDPEQQVKGVKTPTATMMTSTTTTTTTTAKDKSKSAASKVSKSPNGTSTAAATASRSSITTTTARSSNVSRTSAATKGGKV